MRKTYSLVFKNMLTGKTAVLEHYTSRKKADARAEAWNKASDEVKVMVRVES